MRGDITGSRKGLHFFILCRRPISIRLPSDSVKRPSPAPRLQRQQQKAPSTAHKHLLAVDAARKWKTTLWFRRSERILEAWFWRNRRWLIFSYLSSCVVLLSQWVAAARVCRVIRKMSTATLLSVSTPLISWNKTESCCTALHAWRIPFKSTTSVVWLQRCNFLAFMPTCSKLPEINEILSKQTALRPAAFHDETRDERNVTRTALLKTYKDVKVSMKSLIRVYYFQHSIACGIQ